MNLLDRIVSRIDSCPWQATSGKQSLHSHKTTARREPSEIYTKEERARRDASSWTVVQGVLAPAQFVVFAVSLFLVLRYLVTGEGLAEANISVVVKALFLYAIMVTGAIWEKVVFGQYLLAPSFFWEDVFSMLVIALHTAYLAALAAGTMSPEGLLYLALAAYASYVINAGQFLYKMRAARKPRRESSSNMMGAAE